MKNSVQKVAKNIEYEDAPSGHVTFYNYKEPLMKFQDGFGFVGALVYDGYSDKIQCHFCGKWFDALGNHLAREHSMDVAYYKKAVGLNVNTALINEKMRAKLIANGSSLRKRIKNLKSRKGKKHSAATRARIAATLKENRDEQKNLRGTCPDQLIDRLHKLYVKLGRTPTQDEIPFIEALVTTYGSMKEACTVSGIPYRAPGETTRRVFTTKYTQEVCMKLLSDFYTHQGKWPTSKDIGSGMYTAIQKYGGIRYLKTRIMAEIGVLEGGVNRPRFTKEELIRFLTRFEEINGRKPSYSDSKRGLLPRLSTYIYHFGSWRKALFTAFPNYNPSEVRAERKKFLPPPPVLSIQERYKLGKARVAARRARLQKV